MEQSTKRRKRKVGDWISSTFSQDFKETKNKPTIRKRTKVSTSKLASKPVVKDSNNDNWYERYSPTSANDLAIHKKKVEEVRRWLVDSINKHNNFSRILVLNGPSGSGKTITINMLAKEQNVFVEEWINPVSKPFQLLKEAGLPVGSNTDDFNEFLFRCGRYSSVIKEKKEMKTVSKLDNNNKIILIEDFPNYILHNPSEFIKTIKAYHLAKSCPLVLVINHSSIFDGVRKKLREINAGSLYLQINFNPISNTLMQKALKRVASATDQVIQHEQLSSLVSLSNGDIRTAINNFQFLVLGFKRNSLKATKIDDHLALDSPDHPLVLFRAMGKFFYCKRTTSENSPVLPSTNYRDPLICQPEDVVSSCCVRGSTFSAFLHQNYLLIYKNNPLEDLCKAADYFSSSDLISNHHDVSSGSSATLDSYEASVACRGIAFCNSLRATSELCSSFAGTWQPMHKPACFEVARKRSESYAEAHNLFWKLRQSPQELISSTLPYILNLPSHFMASNDQKRFLRDVVSLQKKKSFQRKEEIKIDENEDLSFTSVAFKDEEAMRAVDDSLDDIEDVLIEEFSD